MLKTRRLGGSGELGRRARPVTGPRSAFDAACFAGFALVARGRIRRSASGSGGTTRWERDDSTRTASHEAARRGVEVID